MAVQSERRLAAIMFTDIVGYTSLAQTDESKALERLQEHRSVIRSIFPKYGGTEIKTVGDSFLLEFPSALEAVHCATAIQLAMHDRNEALPLSNRITIRIGVHLGDVVHSQGDILGDAVNVSSRIEPLAEPGGVCISEQVYDHVRNKIDLRLDKLEGKTLKNVKLPIDVYKIVMPWESKRAEYAELDAKRVAVLPLKNMSPDPNDEYFADGMTEELITALSSVTDLTVIARTSVMQYKNAPKRVTDIGRELNVGTVIEGSVRKAANKVRITIQLINAENEGHLWAQSYDRQLEDVFTIQSEVAQKVADALKVKLIESVVKKIERGASANPEAHNLYLKGIFYWNKRTPEALRKAADLFQEAVDLDHTFALGYAGLAQTYQVMAANNYEDPATTYPRAREFALKALSLDDELAEGHTVLAAVETGFDLDLEKGEAGFKRAIELNPSSPTPHQWYAQVLGGMGRVDEARAEVTRAFELSPLSLIINVNVADSYYYDKEYEKGIEQCKKVVDMDPNFAAVYPTMAQNLLRVGKFDEALRAVKRYSELVSAAEGTLAFAYYYSGIGNKAEAVKFLSKLEEFGKTEYVGPYPIALCYFLLGDNDKAFEWLEKAYVGHDRNIILMTVDPELDNVRSDPRYKALLQKTGLSKYHHSE